MSDEYIFPAHCALVGTVEQSLRALFSSPVLLFSLNGELPCEASRGLNVPVMWREIIANVDASGQKTIRLFFVAVKVSHVVFIRLRRYKLARKLYKLINRQISRSQ